MLYFFFRQGCNPEIQRTAQPDLEMALQLLEEHASKINPMKALKVLPDSVPIGRIKHFLEVGLQNNLNARRRTQVLKGLLYAEHLQVQEQRMHYESQSVLMTEFNICPVCKKRFGNQRYVYIIGFYNSKYKTYQIIFITNYIYMILISSLFSVLLRGILMVI